MSVLKQLNVRLPVELHRALARHKELTGEDKSAVIRRGIELYLGGGEMPAYDVGGPEPEVGEDPGVTAPSADALDRVRALIRDRSLEQPEGRKRRDERDSSDRWRDASMHQRDYNHHRNGHCPNEVGL